MNGLSAVRRLAAVRGLLLAFVTACGGPDLATLDAPQFDPSATPGGASEQRSLAPGFKFFGYYWVSSPSYGDHIDAVQDRTNIMFIHPPGAGGYSDAYIDKVNLSGSKLILDITGCFYACPAGCSRHQNYPDVWEHCKNTWINRLRRQNIYAFYLADEPGFQDAETSWYQWLVDEAALVKRDFPDKKTMITGHAVPRSRVIPPGIDIYSISISCYNSLRSCQENYSLYNQLAPQFSIEQLITIGAFDQDPYTFSLGQQQEMLGWALNQTIGNGVVVFSYPNIPAVNMAGAQSNAEVINYHREVGLQVLCANSWENDPVCGANGVTYPNADQAKCAGTTIAKYGDCCTNECTRGQTRCLGNEPQTCVAEGACWVWPRTHGAGCPESLHGWSSPVCDGASRVVQTRANLPGTCLNGQCTGPQTETVVIETCASGSTCQGGACVANGCVEGESRCEGNGVTHCIFDGAHWVWSSGGVSCDVGNTGCLTNRPTCEGGAPVQYTDCTKGRCVDGRCMREAYQTVETLAACTIGETSCDGDHPRVCYDAGGCGVWSPQSMICSVGTLGCDGNTVVLMEVCPRACQNGVYIEGPVAKTIPMQTCADDQVCFEGACYAATDFGTLVRVDAGPGTDADTTTVVASDPQPTSTPRSASATTSRDAGGLPTGEPATPPEIRIGDGFACNSGGDPAAGWALLGLLVGATAYRRRIRRR